MNNCADCEKPIGASSKSGRCRRCFNIRMNADPVFQARRTARIREKMADPMHRAKMVRTITQNAAKWQASPAGKAWMESNGKRLATGVLRRPDVMAKAVSPDARKRATATRRNKEFGWFPPEKTDELLFLMKRKKLTGKEAAAALRAQSKAEKDRAEAALSPFERQMRALERGAKLVANNATPGFGFPSIPDHMGSRPVDNGENCQIMSKSLAGHGKEHSVNEQEELAA